MNIVTDYLKQIVAISKKGVKVSERIEHIQDQDRENFSELVNRVGHLEVEFRSLKAIVNKIPELTQDKVVEAAAPIIQEAHDLSKQIAKKKTMVVHEKAKSLWDKIKRR